MELESTPRMVVVVLFFLFLREAQSKTESILRGPTLKRHTPADSLILLLVRAKTVINTVHGSFPAESGAQTMALPGESGPSFGRILWVGDLDNHSLASVTSYI